MILLPLFLGCGSGARVARSACAGSSSGFSSPDADASARDRAGWRGSGRVATPPRERKGPGKCGTRPVRRTTPEGWPEEERRAVPPVRRKAAPAGEAAPGGRVEGGALTNGKWPREARNHRFSANGHPEPHAIIHFPIVSEVCGPEMPFAARNDAAPQLSKAAVQSRSSNPTLARSALRT